MVSGILIKSLFREYSICSFSKIRGPTNSSLVNILDTLGKLLQSRPGLPVPFLPCFLGQGRKRRESLGSSCSFSRLSPIC